MGKVSVAGKPSNGGYTDQELKQNSKYIFKGKSTDYNWSPVLDLSDYEAVAVSVCMAGQNSSGNSSLSINGVKILNAGAFAVIGGLLLILIQDKTAEIYLDGSFITSCNASNISFAFSGWALAANMYVCSL